jgi:hypothetical protein
VTGIFGAANLDGKAPAKTLFLDIVTNLRAHGITAGNVPAKLEGIAFSRDVVVGGTTKHTLYVANDNDFLASVGGVDNPNKFLVFALTTRTSRDSCRSRSTPTIAAGARATSTAAQTARRGRRTELAAGARLRPPGRPLTF